MKRLLLYLAMSYLLQATNIDKQIEAIQQAPASERYKLMNRFKREILRMQEQERIEAIRKLNVITQSKHTDRVIHEIQRHTHKDSTYTHSSQKKPNGDNRKSVIHQLHKQIKTHIEDLFESEVEEQIQNQIESQVEQQVQNQIEEQTENQIETQTQDQFEDQLEEQTQNQIEEQIEHQVEQQTQNQIEEQAENQIEEEVEEHAEEQTENQIENEVEDEYEDD